MGVTVREAVEETGLRPTRGLEPVVITFDKAGKPINHLLSEYGDTVINGDPIYLTSGLYEPADITPYSGRSKDNTKLIPWLPFDCDLADFVGLDHEKIYKWPQHMIDDAIRAQVLEVRKCFDQMELPIHRIDYTGHGICAYIYCPDHGPEDVGEFGKIHGLLVDRINKIAGTPIADAQVKDAGSRFTRLVPGLNTKSDPPRQTETLEFPGFRGNPVTLDQLRGACGPTLGRVAPPMIVPSIGETLSSASVDAIVHAVRPSWQQGNRHAVALGLSGMLAKAGVPQQQAETIIQRVASGDEEIDDRLKAVATSYDRIRSGQNVGGFLSLREAIAEDALTFVDHELDGIRKATSPRIVIGSSPTSEKVTVGGEVHEFIYQPLPETALSGWIAEYVGIVQPTTEAPVAFHYAAGMAMAGAVIGRSVAIRAGSGPLYSNLFALLIGRSGWSRKDTAIKRVTSLLRDPITLGSTIINPGVHVTGDISSAEGLLKDIADNDGNVLIELPEFSEVMAKAERKGTSTIPTTMMRLYDMPPVVENNSKMAPVRLELPVTTVLAATQPHTLAETMRSLHMTSGFANRFFYVCGDSGGPLAMAEELDLAALQSCYLRLRSHAQAYPEGTVLRMDNAALDRWEDWYKNTHWGAKGSPEEDVMRVRHQDLVMKLALIYAVTDQAESVGLQHLTPALDTLAWSWDHVRQLMGNWGQRLDNEIEARMIAVLTQRGAMKKRDLYRFTQNRKWTRSEMVRVFDSMLRSERLVVDAFGVVGLNDE